MERPPDFEGVFLLLPGRGAAVQSGYRPQHVIHSNYQTSGEHKYLDVAKVNPGESARVAVRFITPEAYPRCLWKGRELSVQEGSRIVGRLTVTSILNEALRVTLESYSPVWVEPPGLQEAS